MTRITSAPAALLVLVVLGCGGGAAARAAVPPAAAAAAAPPAAAAHSAPVRLAIPRLGVDAAVEQVARDAHGAMDVPRDYRDVAWYAPGVVPGDGGDAVIDGHLDWVVGGREVQAVFWRLGTLGPGDEFDVTTERGQVLRFSVVQSQVLPVDAAAADYGLFEEGGAPRLTLVTCAGEWSATQHRYLERLAVTGSLRTDRTPESLG